MALQLEKLTLKQVRDKLNIETDNVLDLVEQGNLPMYLREIFWEQEGKIPNIPIVTGFILDYQVPREDVFDIRGNLDKNSFTLALPDSDTKDYKKAIGCLHEHILEELQSRLDENRLSISNAKINKYIEQLKTENKIVGDAFRFHPKLKGYSNPVKFNNIYFKREDVESLLNSPEHTEDDYPVDSYNFIDVTFIIFGIYEHYLKASKKYSKSAEVKGLVENQSNDEISVIDYDQIKGIPVFVELYNKCLHNFIINSASYQLEEEKQQALIEAMRTLKNKVREELWKCDANHKEINVANSVLNALIDDIEKGTVNYEQEEEFGVLVFSQNSLYSWIKLDESIPRYDRFLPEYEKSKHVSDEVCHPDIVESNKKQNLENQTKGSDIPYNFSELPNDQQRALLIEIFINWGINNKKLTRHNDGTVSVPTLKHTLFSEIQKPEYSFLFNGVDQKVTKALFDVLDGRNSTLKLLQDKGIDFVKNAYNQDKSLFNQYHVPNNT